MILKIIIFIFVLFYIFPFLFKIILRVFLGRLADSFRQQQNGGQQQQYYSNRKEGEVTIDRINDKNKKGKKDTDGEYVDYVEVKD